MRIQVLPLLLTSILVAAGASQARPGTALPGQSKAAPLATIDAPPSETTDSMGMVSVIDLQLRAMDDTIASYQKRKPLLVAGMVGGIVLATVFLIQAQESAVDDMEDRGYGSDTRSSSVNPAYYMGMLAGVGLTTICAIQFNSVSGDISLIQWKKKKLELQRPQSALPQGAAITFRF